MTRYRSFLYLICFLNLSQSFSVALELREPMAFFWGNGTNRQVDNASTRNMALGGQYGGGLSGSSQQPNGRPQQNGASNQQQPGSPSFHENFIQLRYAQVVLSCSEY
jgi:hypothetical protein